MYTIAYYEWKYGWNEMDGIGSSFVAAYGPQRACARPTNTNPTHGNS